MWAKIMLVFNVVGMIKSAIDALISWWEKYQENREIERRAIVDKIILDYNQALKDKNEAAQIAAFQRLIAARSGKV
jgi:hypothetical protein